jgi:hypothetical protein
MLLTLIVYPKRADRGLYRHQRDQGELIPTNPTGPMKNVISGAPIPRRCAFAGVGAFNNRENSTLHWPLQERSVDRADAEFA